MSKEQQPTPKQLSTIESDAHIRTQEATEFDPTRMAQIREFSDKVLEDGQWIVFFQPSTFVYDREGNIRQLDNPHYSPAYMPLYMFFGRGCRLCNMTNEDIVRWRGTIHRASQRAFALANGVTQDPLKLREIHYVIASMVEYLNTVVPGHSKDGFFMKTVFEQRKTLNLLSSREEKKSGWKLF